LSPFENNYKNLGQEPILENFSSSFFDAKLGHFNICDFFSTCNKTLKQNSENWKKRKKSFTGSATGYTQSVSQIWISLTWFKNSPQNVSATACCLENGAHFKRGKKWLKNNFLASLVFICSIFCISLLNSCHRGLTILRKKYFSMHFHYRNHPRDLHLDYLRERSPIRPCVRRKFPLIVTDTIIRL